MKTTQTTASLVYIDPIPFDDGNPSAQRFLLLRFGHTDYTKGERKGGFDFSDVDADAVIKDFSERGKDLVIDYDHATVKGGEAPASGWINSLEKGDDGLYAVVEWTQKAAEFLKQREYRYHSPVIYFGKDGHPSKIHSVALTNHPAMHSYPPLVADDGIQPNKENKVMNEHIKALAKALGVDAVVLSDGAEDEKATAEAITAKVTELSDTAKKTSDFLALHSANTLDDVTGKIAGMVPVAEKTELEGKLAKMNAEKAVAEALNDGKLVESQKAWALDYAEKNLKAFSDFVAASPRVAPGPAGIVSGAAPSKAGETESFSDEDKKILEKFGVSAEDAMKCH